MTANASISTSSSGRTRAPTWTAELAGSRSWPMAASRAARTAGMWAMSVTKYVSFTTSSNVAPAAARARRRFSKTRSAWARASPAPTTSPSSSRAHCPDIATNRPVPQTTWL